MWPWNSFDRWSFNWITLRWQIYFWWKWSCRTLIWYLSGSRFNTNMCIIWLRTINFTWTTHKATWTRTCIIVNSINTNTIMLTWIWLAFIILIFTKFSIKIWLTIANNIWIKYLIDWQWYVERINKIVSHTNSLIFTNIRYAMIQFHVASLSCPS